MTEQVVSAVSDTSGGLQIADRVFSDLIGYAALESYGIVGMAAPSLSDGIAKLLPQRALRRGVVVQRDEDGLLVDLYVIIEHGMNL
ncbi:MAG: Asp23/Gls24 family envelope stress response protein, partial [Coriobacteriales bacterium]|nr:Asp23/Gls24 family envelope stress response protein [Coriobacteriales bacterium]